MSGAGPVAAWMCAYVFSCPTSWRGVDHLAACGAATHPGRAGPWTRGCDQVGIPAVLVVLDSRLELSVFFDVVCGAREDDLRDSFADPHGDCPWTICRSEH